MQVSDYLILGAYILQVVELVFFPLPSETSTWHKIRVTRSTMDSETEHQSSGSVVVLTGLALGTFLSIGAFCLPLAFIILPEIYRIAGPIPELHIPWLQWFAGLLVILGSGSTLSAVLTVRSHQRGKHESAGRVFCTRGLYGIVRNPITAGLVILVGGFFVAYPSWGMLAGVVIYSLNAHFRVLGEERLFRQRHVAEFRKYAAKVPRYLPRL